MATAVLDAHHRDGPGFEVPHQGDDGALRTSEHIRVNRHWRSMKSSFSIQTSFCRAVRLRAEFQRR
jgi:hypothetical protein